METTLIYCLKLHIKKILDIVYMKHRRFKTSPLLEMTGGGGLRHLVVRKKAHWRFP